MKTFGNIYVIAATSVIGKLNLIVLTDSPLDCSIAVATDTNNSPG